MGRTWNWFMGTVRQFVKFVLIVALLGAAGYGSWLAIKKFVLKTQQKTKGAAQNRLKRQEQKSGTSIR